MNDTPRPSSSAHLVDPELLAGLDLVNPIKLSDETLAAARAFVRPGADPVRSYPAVTTRDQMVPGFDGDPEVLVRHHEPAEHTGRAPALLWIHGGGFVMGAAARTDLLCRRIVTETGFVVTSVDYRLAPETPTPGPVHDCYAALAWLHTNSAELGVDPTRIAVGGPSAGGGLAANLAILARDRAEYPVGYQVLIYPMLDDRTASTVQPSKYAGEFLWTCEHNRYGWRSLIGGEPGAAEIPPYTAASRVASVEGLPASYLSTGALDLFVAEDLAFANRLIEAGVPTEVHVYPGAYHAFDVVDDARVTHQHYRDFIGALAHQFSR